MRTLMLSALVVCSVLLSSPADAQTPLVQPGGQVVSGAPALNLNTATLEQLEALPGIGPKTAELIVQYRQKNGPFKKVEELMNVRGIGERSFLRLKPLLTIAPRTEKAGGGW